jgi:hypothetical protein
VSIRIEAKRGRTSVETDYGNGGESHSEVYENVSLLGGMRAFGIDKIEVSGVDELPYVSGALEDEFDRRYEELYGEKYFKRWSY